MGLEVKFHKRSCFTCRYFRIHRSRNSWESVCLLWGRVSGVVPRDFTILEGHARERYCDRWKRRPKGWEVVTSYGQGSPFWADPYLPRIELLKLWKKHGVNGGIR